MNCCQIVLDKNDVEDLGLIKVDMLGLRTLSIVAETLELSERSTGSRPDLDALPLDDAKVYEMCSAADTIGVFQIESRAQNSRSPWFLSACPVAASTRTQRTQREPCVEM